MPPLLTRFRSLAPALAVAVFAIARLPELTRSSLWYDELFSMGVASLPAGESLRRIIADHTNPPLFYILLKGWMAVGGDSDRWVRLLPCLFAMLTGAALVWLAREVRAGIVASVLAVAIGAASPLSVDLSNEVRAYSLLALLAALALAAALRDRRLATHESFVLLTLVNIALVHTHYFGWLTVGAECVTAAWCWGRPTAWRMAKSAAFAALAFLPWAAAVITHAMRHAAPLRNVAWITTPDALAPFMLLRDFTARWASHEANVAWLSIVLFALANLAWTTWRVPRAAAGHDAAVNPFVGKAADEAAGKAADEAAGKTPLDAPDPRSLALLAVAGLAVPMAVWTLSLLWGHSVWVQRYLLGASAPTVLLAAVAITALPPRRWPVAAAAALVWTFVAFTALPARAPTKFDWSRLTRRIDRMPESPRDVFAFEAFTAAPLQRYASAGMRVHLVSAPEELPAGEAWVVYRRESFAEGTPAPHLRALGFTVVSSLSTETAGQVIGAMRIRR